MDKAEARAVAVARARELRQLSWAELRDRYLDDPETVDVVGSTGATYQVQTLAVWDGAEGGDLRVFVAVDDGGWRAFAPLSEDFIIGPDGSFVGE
jgi:hypothetical protein